MDKIQTSADKRSMGVWISNNFSWHGLTRRDEYRRWLPIILIVEFIAVWALWVWGDKGTVRFPASPTGFLLFLMVLPISIGFILLCARRFRSAGISRKWLLPLLLNVNIPIGDHYLNAVMLWAWGVILVGAMKPDSTEETGIY
jgi:uncharacterized membrane protein YhaH (DUF805 family)